MSKSVPAVVRRASTRASTSASTGSRRRASGWSSAGIGRQRPWRWRRSSQPALHLCNGEGAVFHSCEAKRPSSREKPSHSVVTALARLSHSVSANKRLQGGSPPAPQSPGSSAVPPSCELPFLFNLRDASVRFPPRMQPHADSQAELEARAGLLEKVPLFHARRPSEHGIAMREAPPLRDDVAMALGKAQVLRHVLA